MPIVSGHILKDLNLAVTIGNITFPCLSVNLEREDEMPRKQNEVLKKEPVMIGKPITDLIRVAWTAKKPLILEGKHGVGKSEIVKEGAEDLEIQFIKMDLSIMEPPDLLGMPSIVDGRTVYHPPKELPYENGDKSKKSSEGILCFEELNRCGPEMQAPCLELLTSRRLNEYKLPDGWSVIACINPSGEDYQVNDIDPALMSRFMHITVEASKKDWLKYAYRKVDEDYNVVNKEECKKKEFDELETLIHPIIIKIVEDTPDPFDSDRGVPPRTWKYVSDIIKTYLDYDHLNKYSIRSAISGYLNVEWTGTIITALIDSGEFTREDLKEDDDDDDIIDPNNLKDSEKLPGIVELTAAYVTKARNDVLNMKTKTLNANVELMADSFNNAKEDPALSKDLQEHFLDKTRHVENMNKFLEDIPNSSKTVFINALDEDLRDGFKVKRNNEGAVTNLKMKSFNHLASVYKTKSRLKSKRIKFKSAGSSDWEDITEQVT